LKKLDNENASERGDTMTAMYGMMAMVPVLFASAGYVLVSSGGTAECKGCKADD
jgi:hypothetical protein